MLGTVDWTSLFILGSALVAAFVAGLTVGLRFGDLRERVARLETSKEKGEQP